MDGAEGRGRQLARRRRMRLLAAAPAAALLAAACGAGSHPGAPGVGTRPDFAQAMASYVQCMHSHGQPNLYVSRAPVRSTVITAT